MSQSLWNPLSPEEQQRIMSQTYLLLGKQVKRYHKHHHMGDNTSVPVELAQELMESIHYTLESAGGAFSRSNIEETFEAGQEILAGRVQKAKSLLELVCATSPQWQTECRWEALRYLRQYLEHYDYLHMAHKGPEGLFYPILISPPEGIQGIDCCIFYLNILWIENQIMAGVPDDALNAFWDRLPTEPQNQCEQLLMNGLAKALLGSGIGRLVFEPEEQIRVFRIMMKATGEDLKEAGALLCRWLDLKDENAVVYVNAAVSLLQHWIGGTSGPDIAGLFI